VRRLQPRALPDGADPGGILTVTISIKENKSGRVDDRDQNGEIK